MNYIWAGATPGISAPVTRAELGDLVSQIVPPQPDVDVFIPSNFDWSGNAVDTVTWSAKDGDFDMTISYRGTSHIITAGSTTDTYIYWNPASPTVFLSTNLASTALVPGFWLVGKNVEGVPVATNPQQIITGAIIQAATITALDGQIGALAVGTAEMIDLSVSTIKIQDQAVTIPVANYLGGATSANPLQTVIIAATGAPITIFVSTVVTLFGAQGFTGNYSLTLKRGGATIYTTGTMQRYIGGSNMAYLASFQFHDVAGNTGNQTYTLEGGISNGTFKNRFLMCLETKK